MQTYLVGGAVRDKLLNLPTKDQDWVVVGATPDQLTSIGYKQVGADFPVFLHPDSKEEYALARTERKSGHGYTGFEVTFDPSVTLEQDLERRDLTINAIALSSHGDYVDPFNGQQDIEKRVLRHVSDAFREDPLRVLRVARFAARFAHLGFTIAPETQTLLRDMSHSGELEHLVSERVWSEMSRALTMRSPSEFFHVLRRAEALKVVFPELDALFGVPQTMRWHPEVDTGIHTLKALECARLETNSVDILMAVLCHDLGKGLTLKHILPSHHGHEGVGADLIKQIGKVNRWPNNVVQLSENVARYHSHCHRLKDLKNSTVLKMLKALNVFRNPETLEKFTLACQADFNGRSGFEKHEYPQRQWLQDCVTACNAIDNRSFIEQGLTGKAIGEAIDRARLQALQKIEKR